MILFQRSYFFVKSVFILTDFVKYDRINKHYWQIGLMENVHMKRIKSYTKLSLILFGLFILFTVLVKYVDVQSIGPEGSSVGLASLNGIVCNVIGFHPFWYHLTSYLGILCILIAFCFAALGAAQCFARKSLWKVDWILFLLCAFYILVIVIYVFFENVIVNYRPVILEEGLEASYPSTHTMLSICIMATALPLCDHFFHRNRRLMNLCRVVSILIIFFTVIGRLLSGVHWFTDIIGSLFLSSALVMLFYAAYEYVAYRLE